MKVHLYISMPICFILASCGGKQEPESAPMTPVKKAESVYSISQSNPMLEKGRQVWLGTCKVCHGTGLGGAPFIGAKDLWAPRISQGMATLHQHALEGFLSDIGNTMPAKGGNESLSDEEVKLAVNYMVHVSK